MLQWSLQVAPYGLPSWVCRHCECVMGCIVRPSAAMVYQVWQYTWQIKAALGIIFGVGFGCYRHGRYPNWMLPTVAIQRATETAQKPENWRTAWGLLMPTVNSAWSLSWEWKGLETWVSQRGRNIAKAVHSPRTDTMSNGTESERARALCLRHWMCLSPVTYCFVVNLCAFALCCCF